jgi:hypothetical protein
MAATALGLNILSFYHSYRNVNIKNWFYMSDVSRKKKKSRYFRETGVSQVNPMG